MFVGLDSRIAGLTQAPLKKGGWGDLECLKYLRTPLRLRKSRIGLSLTNWNVCPFYSSPVVEVKQPKRRIISLEFINISTGFLMDFSYSNSPAEYLYVLSLMFACNNVKFNWCYSSKGMMEQSIVVGFVSTFLPLFAIANPIGAVPVFLSLLKSPEEPTEPPKVSRQEGESEEHYQRRKEEYDSESRAYDIKFREYEDKKEEYKQHSREQAKQTAIFVFLVLAVFLFGGKAILEHFDISLGVLRIAGGIIVAKIGWALAVANTTLTKEEKEAAQEKDNISFTPMAIPMISGPGAISLVISLTEEVNEWTAYLSSFMAIAFLSLLVWLCLRSSEYLNKLIGEDGMGALKRVFGFFVLAIAVQLIVNGIQEVLGTFQQALFAMLN